MKRIALLGLALLPPFVVAQTAAPPASASSAPVASARLAPVLVYRSAFSSYRPFADDAVGKWVELNGTVNRKGGWRMYARESMENSSSASPASAPHDMSNMKEGAKP